MQALSPPLGGQSKATSYGRGFLLDILDPGFIIYSAGGKYGHPEKRIVDYGGKTARQLVTTKISGKTWSSESEFESHRGQVVGEIQILVDLSGEWYRINGELHKSYSDIDEAFGKDIEEEDKVWTMDSAQR